MSATRVMAQVTSASNDFAVDRRAGRFPDATLPRSVAGGWRGALAPAFEGASASASEPAPPPEWAKAVRQLVDLSRAPMPPPSWWTLQTAFCGGIETRIDPTISRLPGPSRLGPHDSPILYFHVGLAGFGHVRLPGQHARKITPGKAFFAVVPSRHRYHLPLESPGWTFAWIGIQQPDLVARVTHQTRTTGPFIDVPPHGQLAAILLRLLRGAIKKDFHDRFDAELALWELVLACERLALESRDSSAGSQRLLDEVRSRIVRSLPEAVRVDALAAEYEMSRSHFSHFFRTHTGLTPAHFAAEVRVREAARMLRETRAPLKQIANDCGFANANHFCKVFRRFQHLSPMSYRSGVRWGSAPVQLGERERR